MKSPVDWLTLIDEEEGDFDADHIQLPEPVTVELKTNIFREISYRVDVDNPDAFIRSERTYELVTTKKKTSNAAIRRKQQWVKFGACKNVPKGNLERGVTNQRDGNFPFLWNGKNMRPNPVLKPKPKPKPREDEKAAPASDIKAPMGPARYVVPRPWMDDAAKPEIKISNLPQWSDFLHVKELVDQCHRTYSANKHCPQKYRIRMIPSRRTLEEWHADPHYYARNLAEYERMSIVEFDNEREARLAIQVLDGHYYDSHILRVEMAKPRPPR